MAVPGEIAQLEIRKKEIASRGRRLLAYLALAAAIFGMAWSALFVRWAGVPAPASAFYRVLIALLILLPWRVVRGGRTPARTAMVLAVTGGAFFAFDLLLFNSAVLRTSAATAVLLGNNAPIFVGLASWFFFRKRPRLSFWIGLGLALAGCGVIVLWDASRGSAVRHGDAIGDLFALTAAVFWAGYMVTTERVRTEMDTLTFNVVAVTASALTLLVVCLVMEISLTGYSAQTWLALLGLALVSQLASYYALVYALGHLPATITSVSILSQVPLTALLAAAFLGEPLTSAQIVGGGVVLAGIYVVTRT
ncbi:MAG TPA: EamA family transporter [Vicinamibacterales bacterium]|nr:EamA family transporter [Vicinamibacterales bacterium]